MQGILSRIKRIVNKFAKAFDRIFFSKIRRFFVNCNFEFIQWLLKCIILFFVKLALFMSFQYFKYRKNYYNEIKENKDELKSNSYFYKRKIFNDMLLSRAIYLTSPQEYFVFKFYKLSYEGRKGFLTFHVRVNIIRALNDYDYIDYFNFKPATYEKFNKYYKREMLVITDELSFEELQGFINKHNQAVYKPADDFGGTGVDLLDFSIIDVNEDFYNKLIKKGYAVLEEKIKQDPALGVFHEDSVNTIRCVTYLNSKNELNYLWAFVRMGADGSIVDNMGAGGIAAFIDPDKGVIIGPGKDYKGEIFINHPTSNQQIPGYVLPEWDKAIQMIEEMSRVIPEIQIVGWDLAYSDKGWILVEANAKPHFTAVQVPNIDDNFYKFETILKDYKGRH